MFCCSIQEQNNSLIRNCKDITGKHSNSFSNFDHWVPTYFTSDLFHAVLKKQQQQQKTLMAFMILNDPKIRGVKNRLNNLEFRTSLRWKSLESHYQFAKVQWQDLWDNAQLSHSKRKCRTLRYSKNWEIAGKQFQRVT